MNELLQKNKQFEWTPEAKAAFQELKRRFTEEPVQTLQNHFKLNAMPQNMHQEQS